MLLAIFPFIAAAVLYGMSCAELFAESHSEVPANWTAKLYLPVLTGSLTSLAAAAAQSDAQHERLLLSVAGVGVLYTVVVAAALHTDSSFYRLSLHVGAGRRRFRRLRRWHLLFGAGICVMTYGCVATLAAVA